MRTGQEWPWIAAVTLSAGVALAVAAYSFAANALDFTLIAIALVALGAGIILSQMRDVQRSASLSKVMRETARLSQELSLLARDSRDGQMNFNSLTKQISHLQSQADAMAERLERGLHDLQENQAGFMRRFIQQASNLNQPKAAVPPAQPQMPAPEPAPQPQAIEEEAEADVPFGNRLTLSLEPVINLAAFETAHYRMIPGLLDAEGNELAHDAFENQVNRSGDRCSLECFLISEAAGILENLRQRTPGLCVFVPVSAQTLCDQSALAEIVAIMRQHPAVANGIIVEVLHSVLASLPEAGLDGMAFLARAGVAFSLAQSAASGVDMASFRRVNVRFLCFTAASAGVDTGMRDGFGAFVQQASLHGIEVMVTHVANAARVSSLARIARLACGPAFAVPRRLRRNTSENASETAAA